MNHKITKIRRKMMTELDKERYEHTLGVMYTAASLAMRYDEDIEKALLAGLLHDCAKCIPGDTKIKLCKKYHLSVSEVEKKNPSLLHAKLGAFRQQKISCERQGDYQFYCQPYNRMPSYVSFR